MFYSVFYGHTKRYGMPFVVVVAVLLRKRIEFVHVVDLFFQKNACAIFLSHNFCDLVLLARYFSVTTLVVVIFSVYVFEPPPLSETY
jgi:hypothetical protein